MFYENQTMKEVLQDKTIETVKELLFPPNFFDWIYEDKITPKVLSESFKGVGSYAERFDFLKEHIEAGDITRDKRSVRNRERQDERKRTGSEI